MGTIVAMIPARMGSQRLAQKNLRTIRGVSLIARAVRKCREAACFDEIWVNSEDLAFAPIAEAEGAKFHQRPTELGSNQATSEDFVKEFLSVHDCGRIVQVHSIAPLLTARELRDFVDVWSRSTYDVMLACIHDQIEVAFQGMPINFTFAEKTNSQDLTPLQRITWAVTGWKRATFLNAVAAGKNATYHGSVGFYPVSTISGHVIKTQIDLDIAEALMNAIEPVATPQSQ
jgi:CMP-N-acetylneuraminic acid synthetase